MIRKLILIASVAVAAGGCGDNLTLFEGNYEYVKKIDEADKQETVYKRGSNRFRQGYKISKAANGLKATPVKFTDSGEALPSNRGEALNLKQTDDEVFQYKKADGSLVLTFGFSLPDLRIIEFTKDSMGNLKQESTLELIKR